MDISHMVWKHLGSCRLDVCADFISLLPLWPRYRVLFAKKRSMNGEKTMKLYVLILMMSQCDAYIYTSKIIFVLCSICICKTTAVGLIYMQSHLLIIWVARQICCQEYHSCFTLSWCHCDCENNAVQELTVGKSSHLCNIWSLENHVTCQRTWSEGLSLQIAVKVDSSRNQ